MRTALKIRRPPWRVHGVLDSQCQVGKVATKLKANLFLGFFLRLFSLGGSCSPLKIPPGAPRIPPGLPQKSSRFVFFWGLKLGPLFLAIFGSKMRKCRQSGAKWLPKRSPKATPGRIFGAFFAGVFFGGFWAPSLGDPMWLPYSK